MRDTLPERGCATVLMVIGIGSELGGDDAVGLHAARRLRDLLPRTVEVTELQGDPMGLVDLWERAGLVWLIDAVSSGAEPGTVHRIDATCAPLPAQLFGSSTHHVGLAHVVELARVLGRLPRGVVVYGVEAARFDLGRGLSSDVEAAAAEVAASVQKEVARLAARG